MPIVDMGPVAARQHLQHQQAASATCCLRNLALAAAAKVTIVGKSRRGSAVLRKEMAARLSALPEFQQLRNCDIRSGPRPLRRLAAVSSKLHLHSSCPARQATCSVELPASAGSGAQARCYKALCRGPGDSQHQSRYPAIEPARRELRRSILGRRLGAATSWPKSPASNKAL